MFGGGMLTQRDTARLAGVHPDLINVVARAAASFDLFVIEGVRTIQRQRELFAKGASKTLNSRHLTGHAVDLGPIPLDWNDAGAFQRMAAAVKLAAAKENVPITWGGDWRTFRDGPHFELPPGQYP
jgi:peptidoglycan L-alanyl-D-glutamate endopeptidase CwlK